MPVAVVSESQKLALMLLAQGVRRPDHPTYTDAKAAAQHTVQALGLDAGGSKGIGVLMLTHRPGALWRNSSSKGTAGVLVAAGVGTHQLTGLTQQGCILLETMWRVALALEHRVHVLHASSAVQKGLCAALQAASTPVTVAGGASVPVVGATPISSAPAVTVARKRPRSDEPCDGSAADRPASRRRVSSAAGGADTNDVSPASSIASVVGAASPPAGSVRTRVARRGRAAAPKGRPGAVDGDVRVGGDRVSLLSTDSSDADRDDSDVDALLVGETGKRGGSAIGGDPAMVEVLVDLSEQPDTQASVCDLTADDF